MKYDQLKTFINDEMIMRDNKNYQPVMIRYLNQNRGKATRLEIQKTLHDANPELSVKYFKNHVVFEVLTVSHDVSKENKKEDTFYLLDYETFTPQNKAWITMYCDEKIKNSANPVNNRIILFSAAGKKAHDHFKKTIVNDVDTTSLHVDSILKDYPKVRVWGSVNTETQFKKWRNLKKGDLLLFYHDKKYLGSGILEGTEKNSELADNLWGYKDPDTKQSFELVMFMKPSNVFDEDVDSLRVNKLLGYADKFMPTRTLDFFPVVKNKTDKLIDEYGSLEKALNTIGFSFSESKNNLTNNPIKYVLFRHNPPGKKSHTDRNKWNDVLGHEYEYPTGSGLISDVIPGSKAVWMYTENDKMYFWGYGEIESSEEIGKGKFLATMKDFEMLGENNEPKKASVSLLKKIQSYNGWNKYNSIIGIDDKIYNEIVDEGSLIEKTFDDEPLPIPTPNDVKEGIQKISEYLTIPPEKIREILTGLTSGNNIILSGPIGTGKTELARLIPEIFWKSVGGYRANMFTATADWNTQDVIGGIVPKMNGETVTYKIQDGCVTESVRKNWDGALRTYSPGKKGSFRGVWTIIDEFNRADIDKSFGQMFTALRTKDLKAPTDRLENYEKIRIPQDYRIIGTLNTADKHYLFQLSDALKSRFLIIEIGLPGLDKKNEEVYYAIKNALRNFSIETNSIVSFRDGKVIKKDQNFYDLLYQAYNFLSFVRLFKKLGTAILKTVYQNLIAGYEMKYNLKEVLDNSINSVIIPQLEGLPELELRLINNLQKNNLDEFFKELNTSRNKRTVSKEVLTKTLDFLKISEKDFNDFETGEIKDKTVWDKLKINESKQKSEDKMATGLKQVGRSLELLIEQSII